MTGKPHIVIHVDEGVIQSVYCTVGATYEILDTDEEFSETAADDVERLQEVLDSGKYVEL